MAYAEDLLDQANRLANEDPLKPKQVNLRRAVSAAYYAVFHKLVREAVTRLVSAGNRDELQNVLGRAFSHTDMEKACKAFSRKPLPAKILAAGVKNNGIPAELIYVAATFVDLQQARHEADYDMSRRFTRQEVLDHVERASKAFNCWKKVRKTLEGDTFLVALLAYSRIKGR